MFVPAVRCLVLLVSLAFLLFDLAAIQVAHAEHQERNAEHQQPPSDPRSSVSFAGCFDCDCYWSGSRSLLLSCCLIYHSPSKLERGALVLNCSALPHMGSCFQMEGLAPSGFWRL